MNGNEASVFFAITGVLYWDGERCDFVFFDITVLLYECQGVYVERQYSNFGYTCEMKVYQKLDWDGERCSFGFFAITGVLY